jgi:hypothetical protein
MNAAIRSKDDLDQLGNWPSEGHRISSVAHVHAFGMIALTSSMMEEALSQLLMHFLPMQEKTAITMIHKMKINNRVDLLRSLAEERSAELKDKKEHILYALTCFNICAENRNILVHCIHESTDHATKSMSISKRSKKPFVVLNFQLSLNDLRKCAEEIANTVNFILDLVMILKHQPSNTLLRRPSQPVTLSQRLSSSDQKLPPLRLL